MRKERLETEETRKRDPLTKGEEMCKKTRKVETEELAVF